MSGFCSCRSFLSLPRFASGAVILIFLSVVSPAAAQTPRRIAMTELVGRQGRTEDAILLDGLRGRRLFDLAVKHCQMRLADELPAKERASLVMELIKTQTTVAVFAAADQRQPHWDRVDQTVEKFVHSSPVGSGPPPRTFLVRVQQALAHVAQASLIRQELAAELAPETDRKRAIGELRVARKILEELQFKIKDAIPERRRRQLADGELTSKELLALTTNVRYQMAVCNLVRAELYQNDAEGRASRIDALGQVEEQLSEVGRGVTAGDPLWWNTSITRVNLFAFAGTNRRSQSSADRYRRVRCARIPDGTIV